MSGLKRSAHTCLAEQSVAAVLWRGGGGSVCGAFASSYGGAITMGVAVHTSPATGCRDSLHDREGSAELKTIMMLHYIVFPYVLQCCS
jgi:hypothetical protein